MAQTGIYRLVVITLYALKAVVLAGRFAGTPQDTEVMEGADALYTCTVQSLHSDEQIHFTKDGVQIESGVRPWERFKIVHVDTFIVKLTISTVTRSDRGNYSCQIRTTAGAIVETSTQGMLTVLEIPGDSFPTCIAAKRAHVDGDIVELKCVSEETNPLPKLNWDLDANVKNPHVWNSTENGLFTLHYTFVARQSDNGKSFTCSLQTPVNEDVNRICHYGPLSVQYAPNVTIIGQDYYTGREMVLICSAQGNPNPTEFSWSFSKLLDEAQHRIESDNNQILRLHDLNLEDDYLNVECTASNTVGSRSSQFTVVFKPEATRSSQENGGSKQDANASINNTDVTTDSLVVVLAIIFICLFFVVLLLAVPICIIKLHKGRTEMNSNQRELPPQPTSYYDQFNNFHVGNEHYKTMNSSNGSEHNFPVFESRTLPLSHRLPQTNNISQDSWVMTLPLRPHPKQKLTRHRSVEIQVSEDNCPIYEEVGKGRTKVCTESKSIMTDPTLNHYGRADKFLEHIHEDRENGIVEQMEKSNVAKSQDFNPELIVYAKTEFV